jgi:hypothetical protein
MNKKRQLKHERHAKVDFFKSKQNESRVATILAILAFIVLIIFVSQV